MACVCAITVGTDWGQLSPMSAQIESRTGQRPQAYLADGGYISNDDIDELNDPGDGPKGEDHQLRRAASNCQRIATQGAMTE